MLRQVVELTETNYLSVVHATLNVMGCSRPSTCRWQQLHILGSHAPGATNHLVDASLFCLKLKDQEAIISLQEREILSLLGWCCLLSLHFLFVLTPLL